MTLNLQIALPCLALLAVQARAAPPVDFQKHIAPILEQHCVRCHSPGNRKGDVSLATIDDLRENEHIVPGDAASSHLMDLITSDGNDPPKMPVEGDALSEEQVALIRRWIAAGARWPKDVVVRNRAKADASWWSLQPLTRHEEFKQIDDFVAARLAARGLRFNPAADRRTLIRRATYDLTGLPPKPEEVDAFVRDTDPKAYEKLIDRLLESPHYGQRWGRHWLDIVRFGESNGFERNVIINNLWPFRDYVIRSINDDKPFDQFIREHLAGDVLGKDDPSLAVATAFLVAGPYDDVNNQDAAQAAQIRANTLDEIIGATCQAFLGMTIGCARCHDHKFDPVTQRDYYGLYATFAGVRHGAVPLTTPKTRAERAAKLAPLNERKAALQKAQQELLSRVAERGEQQLSEYQARWTRPSVDRTGTEETFEPVVAKFVRLACEAQDINPAAATGFRIDEFEIWSDEPEPRNVALASLGGTARGKARQIEDFPGAYGPQLAIDGKTGARFIATGTDLTIELARPERIGRVVFSSARGEATPAHSKFVFVAEYRIEVSGDGKTWREVAHGRDRKPRSSAHQRRRLLQLAMTDEEKAERKRLAQEVASTNRAIAKWPAPPAVWIGTRNANDAKGPFRVFLGGSPQKTGERVVPASLAVFNKSVPATRLAYRLSVDAPEGQRRLALAEWIVHPDNPLTPRVLANRVWHYHFGTGIVDTPNDLGYMGGRPSHPALLDFLAIQLRESGWRLKALHRRIMTSRAYRQSSTFRTDAAKVDGNARMLWRFPPRRLSAEEIRDTVLHVAGKLDTRMGGPGFRLYRFMQDNVCTYVPLEEHGPETYRRAVYHQNARASVVDLMTDFDQPDCAFSAPRRAQTTTPLQALTMLNHRFTLDMARFMAERLRVEAGDDPTAQVERAYRLCYARSPTKEEMRLCHELIDDHGPAALCRVLLNTSEMIYVR